MHCLRIRCALPAFALLALSACPSDPVSTPDVAGDAAPDTSQDVSQGETTPDVPIDEGTPDATADEGAPDTSAPDVGAPDVPQDVPVVPPDGLLGSPCESDEDCNITGTDDDSCFFGFCTTRCQQSGEVLPGACTGPGKVSAASQHGPVYSCPGDIIYCMPGNVSGVDIICSGNDECQMGPQYACAGAILLSGKKVDGLCMPTADGDPSGSSCNGPSTCASLLCLGDDPDNGIPGQCADHCTQNSQCPGAGDLCVGIGFITDSDAGVSGAWAGLCIDAGSSQTYCNKASKCGDGETCQVFVEPTTLGPQYWCVPANAGGALPGEPCAQASECYNGRCFFGGVTEAEGYCVALCPGGGEDCTGSGMTCQELSLTTSGTPDDPSDDPEYEACVFGQADDFCFVNEPQFCVGELVCEQVVDATDNLGTCVEPPGCSSGAVVCDDGLTCTLDACVNNTCTTSGLQAGTCLIDGTCYGTDDPNPQNACQICAPATDTGAWSAVGDGATCEAGDLCLSGDTCQSGACTEGASVVDCDDGDPCDGTETCDSASGCMEGAPLDCDDGFDCTTDSCSAANGCDNVADDSVCDGGDTDVCDGTTICDPADSGANAMGCVAVGPLTCDDNDVCTGTETCDPTDGCQTGITLDCDDFDVCTSNTCDPSGGCAYPADTTSCPTVVIDASGFTPAVVNVPQNATVTWRNDDATAHSVVISSLSVDSGDIAVQGEFGYTFTTTGSFAVTDGSSSNTMTVNVP